jgi:hypothetical protein
MPRAAEAILRRTGWLGVYRLLLWADAGVANNFLFFMR